MAFCSQLFGASGRGGGGDGVVGGADDQLQGDGHEGRHLAWLPQHRRRGRRPSAASEEGSVQRGLMLFII